MSVSAQYAYYAGASNGANSAEPSPPSPVSNSDESGTISTSQIGVQGCPSNYPYECGGKCWTCGSGWVVSCYNNQPYCCQTDKPYYWGGSCHKCQESYPNECGGSCWGQCANNGVFSCYNSEAKCCPSGYPNYCGKNNLCWTQSWMCDKSISCGGSWQVCGSSTDTAYCDNGQVKCCPSDKPYYWNGQCQQCPSDKPKLCVSTCYSGNECTDPNYPNTNCKSDGQLTCCQSGFPVYCERTGNCWKNQDECVKAQECGSEGWTVCRDSNFPHWNCKPDGKSICCPTDKPYYVDGECRKCPADKPKQCGSTCYSDNECGSGKVAICDKYDKVMCCPSNWPFYCARTDTCALDSANCDALKKCGSEGWTFCGDQKFPNWNCRSDGVSRCCPTGYPYLWSSDWLCHTNQEPQKCSVPDGSSSACTCFSNSDCPTDKPYCEQNYPSPISDGYDACVSSPPEYCGNGNCGSGEDYKNCASDCGSLAPKGTISVDVYYSSGANANKPISGAYVYLDGSQKGSTDSNGKLSFEATYGSRNVKVECPDNTFCAEKTVGVDGAKSVSFGCGCNQSTDSDGDGYSNEDEGLLGTNPKDANSNFKTTFASDSVDLLACIPTPASFFILWKEYKKSGSIIESHSLVVNALNVTSVMSMSFEERPYVVAEALAAANLDTEGAEVIVNPVNVTLESVMKKAEYVDGVRMQDGILLIATDKDGQTTALIAIGAGCVGAFTGSVYGIGQGLFDDIKGVIDGIWFLITHLGEVNKIWGGAKELVAGIAELGKNLDETFWSMFRGILGKGKSINLFREEGLNKPEPYRHFQVGFFYGFVTGYLVEQVALGAVILSKVAKAFKIGQLFGKAGKAAKLMEKLAIIRGTEEFGAEIAEKLGKLKYLKEGIENWLDSEIKGLARIMKHNEDWLKGLGEAEAKAAAKHADELAAAGKVTDAAFGDLTKTKLGQHTLKSADATTDLLAKQSKLVQKWGAKKADEVVTKCSFLVFCDTGRINDLNKILKAMPENLVDDLTTDRAVKFLGDKKLVSAAENIIKGVDNAAISRVVSDIDGYEKLLEYAKAVKKLDSTIVNPLGDIGKHQLLMVIKNPSVATRVGDQTIDGIAVLKKGDVVENWGWEHIKAQDHHNQIQKALGLANNDEAVKHVFTEVIKNPDNVNHVPGDKFKFTKIVTRGEKSKNILVVVSDRVGDIKINKGSIQTANPFD